LVEASGGHVRVVPGQPDNIKITTADDLEAAERLIAARRTRRD
jgi:2-C-methyl-D-erythritol 4-phosphate cytidylyltransferase